MGGPAGVVDLAVDRLFHVEVLLVEIRLGVLEGNLGGLAALTFAGGDGLEAKLGQHKVAVVISAGALLRQLVVCEQFQPHPGDAAELGVGVDGVDCLF